MRNKALLALFILTLATILFRFVGQTLNFHSPDLENLEQQFPINTSMLYEKLYGDDKQHAPKESIKDTKNNNAPSKTTMKEYSDLELYQLGLSPELYRQLLNTFSLEGRSFAFNYTHWIELAGYSNGEPILEITNLNSFTTESYKKVESLFQYKLDKLSQDESLGDYTPQLERQFDRIFYNSIKRVDIAEINIVNCRELFCAVSFSKNDDTDLSFENVHNAMLSLMSSDSISCKRTQLVGPKDKNKNTTEYYFFYHCRRI